MRKKEFSTISLSKALKARVDILRGNMTNEEFLSNMIDYFEITGVSPSSKVVPPYERLEKRMEDIIKILRVQERDYLKPIAKGEVKKDDDDGIDFKDLYYKFRNENVKLKKEVDMLKAAPDRRDLDNKEIFRKLHILLTRELSPAKFKTSTFGKDLLVPPEFFKTLLKKVEEEYVLQSSQTNS